MHQHSEPGPDGDRNGVNGRVSTDREMLETLARTTAHLAAQLTMTQVRLRALATVVEQAGGADRIAVQATVNEIAERDLGLYLKENLGDALVEMIDVSDLESQLIHFLQVPE